MVSGIVFDQFKGHVKNCDVPGWLFGIDFESLKLNESSFETFGWYLESNSTNSSSMKVILKPPNGIWNRL